jgi:large subunit ribosomal protein L9
MKLILTQEIAGLGTAGDVVDVKDGYARNFLLPRSYAIAWSAGSEKQIEGIRRNRQVREVRDLDHAREIKSALEANPVPLKVKAGETGKLFGSVTEKDVALAVKQAGGPDLDRRRIALGGHIKVLGAHKVTVTLHPQIKATLTLDVVSA